MIEKLVTADSEKVFNGNWIDWNEEGYLAHSAAEAANAAIAVRGSTAVETMAGQTAEALTGLTADASQNTFANRTAQIASRGGWHDRAALITALMAQNTANGKARQNAIVSQHEANVKQLEARAVAEGWSQPELQQAYDDAVQESQTNIERARRDHDDAHEDLKGQLSGGADDEVSVPPSMPSGPGDGSAAPTLDHDESVASRVSDMLGTGGGGMPGGGMDQIAGIGQQLAGAGAGALQHPPGLDQASQLPSQIGQMLQGMTGGSGSEGMSEITPEQLDTLLAGQGDGAGDGAGAGDAPSADVPDLAADTGDGEDITKPEGPEFRAEPPTERTDTGAPMADSSTQQFSAAPPASAVPPTTQLTSDGSGAVGSATSGAATVHGATLSPSASAMSSSIGSASATGDGTHLTSAGAATGAATSGGGGAAPGAGAAGAGAPLLGGGAVAGGGAPMSLGAMRRRIGEQARAQASATTGTDVAPPFTGGGTGTAVLAPVEDITAEMAALPDLSAMSSTLRERAASILATLTDELDVVGMDGPVAVAMRDDGTAVAVTPELGILPLTVTSAPTGVTMLADSTAVPAQFREDRTGVAAVGETLRLAAALGFVDGAIAVASTSAEPGVAHIGEGDLASASRLAPAETSGAPRVEDSDLDAALALVKAETDQSAAMHTVATATGALVEARGTDTAAEALRVWLAVSAASAATRGDQTAAARCAWQAIQLPPRAAS